MPGLRKRFISFLIILTIVCLTVIPGHAKKTYRFAMPVVEGVSMGSIPKLLSDTSVVLEKKTGLKVEMDQLTYKKGEQVGETLIDLFKKKKLDFGLFYAQDFARYKLYDGKIVKPMFVLSMFGETHADVCMYTRKSDDYIKVKQLKGKTWGGSYTMPTRYMLYKNKHKKPIDDFFGKVKFVDDTDVSNLVKALVKKDIDVFFLPSFQFEMLKNSSKDFKKVRASSCKEYVHHWIFVYRKGVSKKAVKKFQKTFYSAHKDKDFAQFKFLLTAIQGKFVKYKSKNMKTTKKIMKLAEKYDWFEEEEKFIRAHR